MQAVVVVFALALARVAVADPTVGVVVTGEPTLQARVQLELEHWLAADHDRVVTSPLGAHRETFVDCFLIENIKCARSVFDHQATVDGVIYIRVELLPGSSRELALTGYWFARAKDPVAEKRACKACDDAALTATLGSLLGVLVRLEHPKPTRTKLPPRLLPGAAIGLGAAFLISGTTYLYYGHLGGADDPYVYPDATKLGATLSIVGAGAVLGGALWWRRSPPDEHGSRLLPVALVAGGAVALGGGAIALAYASKRGPDAPFVYPHAAAIGTPLAIAGGGAIVTGALLWLSDRAPQEGTPTASVTSHAVTVGWAGRL